MEKQTNINVNMTGEEYIKYKEKQKTPLGTLSKPTKKALPFFFASAIGILFLSFFLFGNSNNSQNTSSVFSAWHQASPILLNTGWDGILKYAMLYFGPFIIIMVGIAWVFHGVGFALVKR